MHSRQSSSACFRILIYALVVIVPAANGFAGVPKEQVIYNLPWTVSIGSAYPSSLVADAAGNLYGTILNAGEIFELSPPATPGGTWTSAAIYSASSPAGAPCGTLVFDQMGNLYGTTIHPAAVFELSPPVVVGGTWTYTTLLALPTAGCGRLVMDEEGNIYGSSSEGGLYGGGLSFGYGIAFELIAPQASGDVWKERVLHNFGSGKDGRRPNAGLLLRGGILYGTTSSGGANQSGTVFQLVRKPGAWTETILYDFTGGSDGSGPSGGLIQDEDGNLYGNAGGGGVGWGTTFRLSPPAMEGDPWTETTLYSFTCGNGGGNPVDVLLRNKLGNLYGVGSGADCNPENGAVFELMPPAVAGGDWTLVHVHSFGGPGDGSNPFAGLTFGNGGLYGTTDGGGSNDEGVAFSISVP